MASIFKRDAKVNMLIVGLPITFCLMVGFFSQVYLRGMKSKSRQKVAKLSLRLLCNLEDIRHEDLGSYDLNFQKTGFTPTGIRDYVIGFSLNCPGVDKAGTLAILKDQAGQFPDDIQKRILNYFKQIPCAEGYPEKWQAFAVGSVEVGKLDIWRIDQEKRLDHLNEK